LKEDLTKEQREELNRLTVAMAEEAISVRMDYEENGSNLDSGSVVAIHQNSSLLDDEREKLGDIAYNITRKEK
jgi:hypothetical protein|tara:strand:- start:182 stop:400 length:219 start_codon:yes stop_codon:yes gene_type:complete